MKPQYTRIEESINKKYGIKPEFLWKVFPEYGVFRHDKNRKWFGLLMNISPQKLIEKNSSSQFSIPQPIREMAKIHVLDLKMPLSEIPSIYNTVGIYTGYPRSAGGWISIILEDLIPDALIMKLIEKSYNITSKK